MLGSLTSHNPIRRLASGSDTESVLTSTSVTSSTEALDDTRSTKLHVLTLDNLPVPYLQHAKDRTMTRAAIMRLSARLGRPFAYGELSEELKEHDNVEIDGRGYGGALEAVARNQGSTEPLWTAMVVNAKTRPGDGQWIANSSDRRYVDAGRLSSEGRDAWLEAQRAWCIANARVEEQPLDQQLRDIEVDAREAAELSLIELLCVDHQRE